jgi:hypothetical protein
MSSSWHHSNWNSWTRANQSMSSRKTWSCMAIAQSNYSDMANRTLEEEMTMSVLMSWPL